MQHLNMAELEEGLPHILNSPKNQGSLKMIVIRPDVDQREVLPKAELDTDVGLVGDGWKARGHKKSPGGLAHPDRQITLMNARAAQLVAQSEERWPLAGDQLFVDIDLSDENMPVGTRLKVGDATLEVTAEAHNGCLKFVQRFGRDAMVFVNKPTGKKHHLRGIYAKVVQSGTIQAGDCIAKV